MSLQTVTEYAKTQGISRQAVYKKVNQDLLKIEKKNNKVYIVVKENVNLFDNQETPLKREDKDLREIESLKKGLQNLQLVNTSLQSDLKAKNEIINLKDENLKILETKNQEIINSKSETIESQKKTIQALEITYTQLEIKYQSQAKQLTQQQEQTNKSNQEEKIIIEPQEIKNQSPPKSPKTENTKIELMEFLQIQGITDPKRKQAIRARFNRKIGKDKTISKNKKGKIYLDKNQNYTKILNP